MQTAAQTYTRPEPVTEESQLQVGRWYAIGFLGEDDKINWYASELARYEGDGLWITDTNQVVDGFYDPFLGLQVAGADAYLPQ